MPSENHNAQQFDVLQQKYEAFRTKIPDIVAILAVNFFKRNFELQGFMDNGVEKWKTLSNPADRSRQILRKRGTLKNAIRKITTERNKVIVGVGNDVKYAALQNYGGQIPITPKMRRYFWAMYKQTKQEYYKGLALTKKKHLDIPARKFIGDSATLVKEIDKQIVEQINLAIK